MKNEINELAYFGGEQEFSEKLHVGRPNIGSREKLFERINSILDKRWLTNAGPNVQEFEKKIADFIGVKHCVAMCNATVALEICIRAMELKGEVIVPSFTFIACAHSLQWQEITPVFCDIDPQTHLLDPHAVEKMLTPRTTGIMGVHLWGRPCRIDALTEIANRHKLKLFFDASHGFGNSLKGKMLGSFGEAEIFSFHATKFFNTLEGGAVTTNNDELAAKMRLMKNFGFAGYDNVIYIGTNGKMNEFSAAMGLTGLDSLDDFIKINHRNYNLYRQELSGVSGLQMVLYDEKEKCNFQYIVFEVDEHTTGISRDLLMKILHSENILARRYFYPGCHRMEPYRSFFPHAGLLLNHTERLSERVISFPSGTSLSEEYILKICSLIRFILDNGKKITEMEKQRKIK